MMNKIVISGKEVYYGKTGKQNGQFLELIIKDWRDRHDPNTPFRTIKVHPTNITKIDPLGEQQWNNNQKQK